MTRRPANTAAMLNIAVLISGGGSTLANLIERIADGRLTNTRIVRVISSRSGVGGVEIARAADLPLDVVRRKDHGDHAIFGGAVFDAVRAARAELVVMGGYLCYLPIATDYRSRVLNVHPALLPAHGGAGMMGMRVHEAVLAAGERRTGCTVHIADDEYDHGPIVAQRLIDVRAGDTAETLAVRVGELERDLYPEVIQRVADHGPAWLDQPDAWPVNSR